MNSPTEGRPRADIESRADLETLLRRFYGQALIDAVLTDPFTELRLQGLESHLPVMCDFWQTVLFGAGLYQGSAVRPHQSIHDRHGLTAAHFLRWLVLWYGTIDQMYQGPMSDRAKLQATRMAWAMHRRLTGIDSPELKSLIQQAV